MAEEKHIHMQSIKDMDDKVDANPVDKEIKNTREEAEQLLG